MFDFVSKKKHDFIVESLEASLRDAEARIAQLVKKEAQEASVAQASMNINLNAMRPFSIERMFVDGSPATVYGYKTRLADGSEEICEWNLFCSNETHEKLFKEFETWCKRNN